MYQVKCANARSIDCRKFFINDFFSKCDQILRKLRIRSHLLNKSLMENFIFCAVLVRLMIFLILVLIFRAPVNKQFYERSNQAKNKNQTTNNTHYGCISLECQGQVALITRTFTYSVKISVCLFLIQKLQLLTLLVPKKLKNSIFEIPIIPQTLNINNQRTTSAKSINLVIIRKLI